MSAGKKSLLMKNDTNPVWYAPATAATAACTAFWRTSSVLPFFIVDSRALTKSVNIVSTPSRPARTVMTSELGLGYFLLSMHSKKTVKVLGAVSRELSVCTAWTPDVDCLRRGRARHMVLHLFATVKLPDERGLESESTRPGC